jgi:hypothetical protein
MKPLRYATSMSSPPAHLPHTAITTAGRPAHHARRGVAPERPRQLQRTAERISRSARALNNIYTGQPLPLHAHSERSLRHARWKRKGYGRTGGSGFARTVFAQVLVPPAVGCADEYTKG